MGFQTKLKLINAKMEQPSGGTLTLSGDTTVADSGDLRYESHPTFVDNEQIVDKKYVDDNIVSGGTYSLSTPSTVTVGGLNAGSELTGLTSNEILEDILVPYITATIPTFSIAGEPTVVEVGTQISGGKNFEWTLTRTSQIASNSFGIFDVQGAANILTGSDPFDLGQNVSIVTKTFASNGEQQAWYGFATDTVSGTIQSPNFTITAYYPYYYGKVVGAGAAGDNRPTATSGLVTSGTKVVANSDGTITVTFNSATNEYIWFATPAVSTTKTVWYETELNQGTIGGAVSPGGNFFPNPDVVSVTEVLWSGVNYKVYIANYQSAVGTLQFRNS